MLDYITQRLRPEAPLEPTRQAVPVGPGIWQSPTGGGEFAWDLRDNASAAGLDPSRYRGREVTGRIKVTRQVEPGVFDDRDVYVVFDGGDSDEEFYRNFWAQVREAIEDSREEYDEEYGTEGDEDAYTGTSVTVTAFAA